jgi:hypothetical protein
VLFANFSSSDETFSGKLTERTERIAHLLYYNTLHSKWLSRSLRRVEDPSSWNKFMGAGFNWEMGINTNALNKMTSPPPSPLEGEGWVGGKKI